MGKLALSMCVAVLAVAGSAQAGGYVYSPASYYYSPPGLVVPQYYAAPIPVGVVQPVVVTSAYVQPVVYATPVTYVAPVSYTTYYSYSAPTPYVVAPVAFGPRGYSYRSRTVGGLTRSVQRVRW